MGVRSLVTALLFLLLAPSALAADKVWTREAQVARAGLARSLEAGYNPPAEERRYLGILSHARVVHGRIPPLRRALLENVLAQVGLPKSPTGPRALQLYTTLLENAEYLAAHRVPVDGTDVTGDDGAVYRFFADHGLEFHPLANGSKLNALVAAGDTTGARALVAALSARALPQANGSAVWEYRFNFGSQADPWTSGMAQAVLAQALARAGAVDLARRAYLAIPGLLDRQLAGGGTWIKLYSGSRLVVLNAQLQSAISIADYAQIAGDAGAAAYANGLLDAAKSKLELFDTGHWSRYSLGEESTLHYQDYVISLLKLLGKRTSDPIWTSLAGRFELYETEPPLMTGTSLTRLVYPQPEDGVRDDLDVRFFLSKPSKVVLVVDGEAVDGYTWHGGWHTFSWTPRTLPAGEHSARLVARGADGNPGSTDLGSFTVARDSSPPLLAAAKGSGRVFWHAKDAESACCRIRVLLSRNGEHKLLTPTRAKGAATVPEGYWSVTVVAVDAAGNRAEKPLGLVVGHRRPAR